MPVNPGATPTEINFSDSDPAIPAGKVGVKWQASNPYPDPNNPSAQVRDLSGYVDAGGATPSASTASIATASLANGASETGSIAIFKTFSLLQINFSCKARVELYATAAARDNDASRAWGTAPTLYAENEIICDVQNSNSSNFTWVMSPAALGFNADSPGTTAIYYRVTNLDTAQAVTITLTVLQMEA